MNTLEHELLVVVKVCESNRGARRALIIGTHDADDERRAMFQAADACGTVVFADDRDDWLASCYVQRITLRLPIEAETIPTIVVEPARKSTTKRLPIRRR